MSDLSDGPSFLILDDLYHIRRADQAKVIDCFHRVAKSNKMWVKIGTIKHRSQWYELHPVKSRETLKRAQQESCTKLKC